MEEGKMGLSTNSGFSQTELSRVGNARKHVHLQLLLLREDKQPAEENFVKLLNWDRHTHRIFWYEFKRISGLRVIKLEEEAMCQNNWHRDDFN